MQPTGLIPAVVLGLSTLTAALPALEIRAWGNGRECTTPTMCSSGLTKVLQRKPVVAVQETLVVHSL
ncbi:uncharacterized protein RSE6_01467 [Rhynchosporium secalis]|uniref:Uncharacterized protein n=1 Tax=Rhynchosporium secalis TaxID=38038 RepID=A0A1E1LXX2_RHYSE|nr:uncharacterized protein RSE6_01467 [Rhynchosporium secalis]